MPPQFQPPDRIMKSPLLGAAGGKAPEPDSIDGQELFDVRPMTVGLVKRGANRRSFFLAKSEGEGNTMAHFGDDISDLDAALTHLELAAGDEDENLEEVDPGAEGEEADAGDGGKKKDKVAKGLREFLAEALTVVENRRARDPMLAAQRALGNVGGHPELMDIARQLMAYMEKHGGKPQTSPKPTAEPAKKPADTSTAGDSNTGDFSLAEKSGGDTVAGDNGATAPNLAAEIQAAVSAAIDPLIKRLGELETKNGELEQSYLAGVTQREETALTPLAKSMNLKPGTLVMLKKSMAPEEYEAMTQQAIRAQRMAESSGFFGEVGTSQGGSESDSSPDVLLMKSAQELVAKSGGKLPFGDALIQASTTLGMGLGPTRELEGGN